MELKIWIKFNTKSQFEFMAQKSSPPIRVYRC